MEWKRICILLEISHDLNLKIITSKISFHHDAFFCFFFSFSSFSFSISATYFSISSGFKIYQRNSVWLATQGAPKPKSQMPPLAASTEERSHMWLTQGTSWNQCVVGQCGNVFFSTCGGLPGKNISWCESSSERALPPALTTGKIPKEKDSKPTW